MSFTGRDADDRRDVSTQAGPSTSPGDEPAASAFDEDDAGRRFANVLAVVLLGGQQAGQPCRHVDAAVRIV
jgi:hypothetical protein